MTGILYGVGVGPGDAELITFKAARLIKQASAVAFICARGAQPLARTIAAEHLVSGVEEIIIDIPMDADEAERRGCYASGVARITDVLADGRDVVFVCEGDPMVYGSFVHVLALMPADARVEIVPGISSPMAAASSARRALASDNDVLTVLPATLSAQDLSQRLAQTDSVVILKVGRHLAKVRIALEDAGMAENAILVERASTSQERITPLADVADAHVPYFSLILAGKA